jgi:integrase
LTTADLLSFRDLELARVSVTTANFCVSVLRIALNQARREGLIQVNPAMQVSKIRRRGEALGRRPFSLPELKQVLEVANDEWKGMIAFGVYTGQRLSDLALLTWANVDMERAELRLVTQKTRRRQIIPLANPLIDFLAGRSVSDNPKAPLFPNAHRVVSKQGRAGGLSNQFYGILVAAGLVPARSHHKKADGLGRAARRTANELSFHCLRHTATSLLKNAGVSQAVAMEFIGHETEAISQQYTHIESESLKIAAGKLPNIFATRSSKKEC